MSSEKDLSKEDRFSSQSSPSTSTSTFPLSSSSSSISSNFNRSSPSIDDDGLEYLQDKCGLFACIANGDWPTNLDVAHIICLGLVGLQHRPGIRRYNHVQMDPRFIVDLKTHQCN
ncbi:hypothetical protein QR98_0006560 [Sarcoptes scabiei]|uniref:Uncharacterized protein n=1 Tax=Sarcoptes scabiei TaxID=52283 RepID=A0A131ZU18_SARSC|nr:hypothetical protein QR98_0006560 [Sarcoptes scabiei]